MWHGPFSPYTPSAFGRLNPLHRPSSCSSRPLTVGLKVGFTAHFWINLLLWLFTWIGGIIHGLYIVLK